MDQEHILETLSAHDKVRSMTEVLEWKFFFDKKQRRDKREDAVEFFGNARITKKITLIEKAIKSIALCVFPTRIVAYIRWLCHVRGKNFKTSEIT